MRLFFLVGGFISLIFLSGCSHINKNITQEILPPVQSSTEENNQVTAAPLKIFTLIARRWSFDPSVIRVKKGDTVRININNLDAPHGFAIEPYGINKLLSPGRTTTVEFVADKEGTFDFFCSVMCGEGHGAMKGTLIVEL